MACDVGGIIRCQEQHDLGLLIGLADAIHGYASIADQDVDAPELINDLPSIRVYLGLLRDIADNGDGPPTVTLDLGYRRFGCFLPFVIDRHNGTLDSKHLCYGKTDAGASTGDDDHFIFESHALSSSVLTLNFMAQSGHHLNARINIPTKNHIHQASASLLASSVASVARSVAVSI